MGRWWSSNGFATRADLFRQLRSLYPAGDWDQSEAEIIRIECEKIGLPMGYGRVGQTPTQLTDSESRGQWGRERR